MCAAPVGNQFWRLAKERVGRPLKFQNSEELWGHCVDYFEWVEANPLYEDKLVTYEGEAKHEPLAKMRAMSIGALCLFLGISQQAWSEYRKREEFGEVVTRVEAAIRAQKFEGASADLLNANIIARDLGLADRSELTGANGGPIKTEDVSATREAVIDEARRLGIDIAALGLSEAGKDRA